MLAVFTDADLAADGLGTDEPDDPRKRPDGSPMFWRAASAAWRAASCAMSAIPWRWSWPRRSPQAKDAAELIEVDYEPLPAITATGEALLPGAPAAWADCPDNISHVYEIGDKAAADAAFAAGGACGAPALRHHPRPSRNSWSRAARSASMTPRDERFTLYADVQYPHRVREMLANRIFKVPRAQMRVVAGDVGGGFGIKGWQYVEHRLVLFAARQLGRPVKWRCERSEAILADEHGRDVVADAELALDRHGKFLGLKVRTSRNIGAYLSAERNMLATFTQPAGGWSASTPFPPAHVQMTAACHQHQPDRALSRRRPAGGDLHHRAHHRRRGARAGHRPRRAPPAQHRSRRGDALQDRARLQLRLRRVRQEHGARAGARRRRRLRGARARHRSSAASCAASASPTPSSARPAPAWSSPRSASTAAAAPPC